MRNFWKIFWIFTLIVLAMQLGFYYPDLPDKMAVHFDSSGKPDNWSGKGTFLILMALAIIICNIWVPMTGWLMRKMPDNLISIPNKHYWLANEKSKERLISITRDMMAMVMGGVNLIFIYAMKYTYDINMGNSPEFRFLYIILPMVFVTIVPIIYYLRKLRVPDKAGGSTY
jgi:uncharacterized membrane protein